MDAAGQMAADDVALEQAAGHGRCVLRIYRWAGASPHAATFGYSQAWSEAEAGVRRRYEAVTFPIVRRPTGGGVVFHDGDLTFSFIFPWTRLFSPMRIYRDIHEAVLMGLRGAGVQSLIWTGAGAQAAAGIARECFSRAEPMDLVDESGVKILGGALRRRKGVGLYQGSLRPEGLGASMERLGQAVEEGLSLKWGILFEPRPWPPAAAAAADRLRVERYCSDEWNRRR